MEMTTCTPTGARRPSVAVAALLAITTSLAQAADDPTVTTPKDDGHRELPTVIVTAQKIAQTLEQVPAAVTTIDGEFIDNTGITDFTDLQNYAANININVGTTSSQIGVRGFTTPDTNRGFDPSVGAVVDGVYYGRNSFLTAFFHDMDRFEVLKGPQGTLFGKNSTAGVLNLTTRAPDKDYQLSGTIIRDSDGELSVRPAVNIPLTEKLLLRVSGSYSKSDGVLYNTFLNRPENDPHINSTRARLRYLLSDDWTLDLNGFSSKQYLNFNLYTLTKVGDAMRQVATSYDPNFDSNIENRHVSANVPAREIGLIRGANFTADHNFGKVMGLSEFHFVTTSSYGEQLVQQRDLDADFTAAPFIRDTLTDPSPYQQISEEFRFTGAAPDVFGFGKGFTFITGFFFYQSTYHTSDYFFIEDLGAAAAYEAAVQADNQGALPASTLGGGGVLAGTAFSNIFNLTNSLAPGSSEQSARVKLNQKSRTYSFFNQSEYSITDQWGLIAGFRLALETKDGDAHSKATGPLVPLIANQKDHDTSVSREEKDVSPKLGFKWVSLDKSINAYGTWSRGFKSGGFNALPLAPDNLEYGPERASSYELGTKVRTLYGSLFLGAAVFETTFSDLQISSFQNNSFVVLNAGKARSRGADLDIRWLLPINGASLFASFGFADAKYVSYPNAPAKADSGQSSQDLSGQRLAFSSRYTASVVPSYSLFMDSVGLVSTVAVDVVYRSKSYLDVDNDERKQQPNTTLLNLRTTLASGDKRWALTLGVNNLTDRLILDQVIGQPLAPGNFVSVRTDRGRYYSSNLNYNF
jgi:iron complex outermembrane receptor protein